MSHTRDMFRKHSAFFQARRDAANGAADTNRQSSEKSKPSSKVNSLHEEHKQSDATHAQPPDYYHQDHQQSANRDDLPSYTAAFTYDNPPPQKTLRSGKKIGDFFGAAFTGYIPKERAPAWEVFEPRRRESMGSTPGAPEARRCTGGMVSSGKPKEKKEKKGERASIG